MHLNCYPAQYINCMTSDSKFVAFVTHDIQLALNLMAYLTIWAVLLILLETQDINASMYRLCMTSTMNATTRRLRTTCQS